MRLHDYGRGVMSSIFRRREEARALKGGQKVNSGGSPVVAQCLTLALMFVQVKRPIRPAFIKVGQSWWSVLA